MVILTMELKEGIIPSFVWKFVRKIIKNPIQAGILGFLIYNFLKKNDITEERFNNNPYEFLEQLKEDNTMSNSDGFLQTKLPNKGKNRVNIVKKPVKNKQGVTEYIYIVYVNGVKKAVYDNPKDAAASNKRWLQENYIESIPDLNQINLDKNWGACKTNSQKIKDKFGGNVKQIALAINADGINGHYYWTDGRYVIDKVIFNQKDVYNKIKSKELEPGVWLLRDYKNILGIQESYLERLDRLNEDITIPINIGDTVLGGKFKNKKVVVKSIDKNDKGEITINGKPLMKYRIIKKEMAVVDKTKAKKTPREKILEANKLFRSIFNKLKYLKDDYYFMRDNENIDAIGNRVSVAFGGSFEIDRDKAGIEYGYYELNKDINSKYKEFISQVKKIGKFNLPNSIKIDNSVSYTGDINGSFHVIGRLVLSQVVVYLYDKNKNKKIKLGTYNSKWDADEGEERDWGFNIDNNWRDKTATIYYWGKTTRRVDYKTFNDESEARKYYNNMEISIEEVER